MTGHKRIALRLGAMGLALAFLAACDGLGLGGEPELLRVQIDTPGDSQVTLVTSTRFTFQADPACDAEEEGVVCPNILRVLQADTTTVSAPMTEQFPFTESLQYFVSVYPAEGPATISLRVWVDDEPWSNESRALEVAGPGEEQETIQFVYQWSEPTLR